MCQGSYKKINLFTKAKPALIIQKHLLDIGRCVTSQQTAQSGQVCQTHTALYKRHRNQYCAI